ncbi:MAG: DNA recombination protein RmuC [Planctomycetota bacterium]|nr:MAG: DNA recombination protein RmuC [Planctomycetota bacterium]
MDMIIGLLIGVLLGGLLGIVIMLLRHQARDRQLRDQVSTAQARLQAIEERSRADAEAIANLQERLNKSQEALAALDREHARSEQAFSDAKRQHAEQQALLLEARTSLTEQFKVLSTEVLRANSQQLAEQQGERLKHLLAPFDTRLKAFQDQVRQAYESEVRERVSLKEELKRIAEQGERMTREADGLARALKGEAKTRGDWGEVILERILEQSGLRRDAEYRVQATHHDEEHRRFQPDVIIDLPDGKHLVIDSKLPLLSWMKVCEAEDEATQLLAIAELRQATRTHIRGLSTKAYEQLAGINSVDFVLCFIPIEAAFACVVNADHDLYREAMERNVILVSPTTLLATMRTVALTWRSERQERNALRIAQEAGRLYDGMVGFVEAMDGLGQRLDQAASSYQLARKRLVDGRGNIIRRAEQIRHLGARAAKRLGNDLIEEARVDEGDEDVETLELET